MIGVGARCTSIIRQRETHVIISSLKTSVLHVLYLALEETVTYGNNKNMDAIVTGPTIRVYEETAASLIAF